MIFSRARAAFWSVATAFVLLSAVQRLNVPTARFADAADPRLTTRGAHVYERECGACHGRHLQGQIFWQLADEYAGRRAPALDQTGRIWRRSDEDLFHVVKFGRYPERSEAYPSHMPAFVGQLDDRDVLAVLAFVKARWPIGQRALQSLRNPENRGMPAEAETTDWRLAATCFGPQAQVASTPAEPD